MCVFLEIARVAKARVRIPALDVVKKGIWLAIVITGNKFLRGFSGWVERHMACQCHSGKKAIKSFYCVKRGQVSTLLDAGATSYFISQSFASLLVKKHRELKSQFSKYEGFQMLAANGNCCNMKMKLRLHFKLAGYIWMNEFWIIPSLICSMIFVIQCFAENKVNINFQTNMLTFVFRPQTSGIKLIKDKPKAAMCSNLEDAGDKLNSVHQKKLNDILN
ncbi:hypothetical protein PR048_013324 [Dryococelus australis]|uniref:Uncharacterized protein n=1 Tax=Dryococelus australis TaxID=614101 RepID=A0ABQ9HSN5_9NEOP|nr:hypothetical protein PR048_013324 [Dryococelus australis]